MIWFYRSFVIDNVVIRIIYQTLQVLTKTGRDRGLNNEVSEKISVTMEMIRLC